MINYDYEIFKPEKGFLILCPGVDPAAHDALWAYAAATDNKLLAVKIQKWMLKLNGDAKPLPPTRRKIDELKTSVTKTHHELATCNIGGNGLEEAEMIMAIAKKMGEGRSTLPLEYLVEDDKRESVTRFGINVLLIDRVELMELLHYKALALKHNLTLDEEVD